MTKDQIFKVFSFLESDNILYQDQLDSYVEWVVDGLENDLFGKKGD